MDMCYDGTLVMPSSYAMMEEDEMCYIEGGSAHTYKKGNTSGYKEAYQTAATLAYFVGVSWIINKASTACTIMAGPVATVFGSIAKLASWACAYFAEQFFYAAETAKAMCKKSKYTIEVVTHLGVPTSVVCY